MKKKTQAKICFHPCLHSQHYQWFKTESKNEISNQNLNNNLMSDPNLSYEAFEDFVIRIKHKHMPMKTVRFDKNKYKMTKWVTTRIIKSIKFRDKLYKQLKSIPVNSQEYNTMKINVKTYNQILKKHQNGWEGLSLWTI